MTVLVAVETLLLVLLALMVVALLRSHAEILRRLGPPTEEAGSGAGARHDRLAAGLPSPPERTGTTPAADLAGTSLQGDGVQIGLGPGSPSTLLAFLSSGCLTCETFWREFAGPLPPEIPGGGRLIVVTKDTTHESPSRLRELASPELEVVMSSAAWEAYDVPTSPYFVYVDGPSGTVHGEGAASGWAQVASLLRDAIDDGAEAVSGVRVRRAGGAERARRVEDELAAAGIQPGDPSLYPTGSPDDEPTERS
jgi:hypothetical protein